MKTGVPQRSVLGSTLWNVLYDPILNIQLTEGCQTVAYADGLAPVIKAHDKEELMFKANQPFLNIDLGGEEWTD